MASFYIQWHGPNGLRKIAEKVRFMAQILIEELTHLGIKVVTHKRNHFDTVTIKVDESGFSSADFVQAQFHKFGINIRKVDNNHVSVSFDELSGLYHLDEIIEIFANLKRSKIGHEDARPFEVYM